MNKSTLFSTENFGRKSNLKLIKNRNADFETNTDTVNLTTCKI